MAKKLIVNPEHVDTCCKCGSISGVYLQLCDDCMTRFSQLDAARDSPANFEPHARGDGKRFHVRTLQKGYQVYGYGLQHVCMCVTQDMAEMVAAALEQAAERADQS